VFNQGLSTRLKALFFLMTFHAFRLLSPVVQLYWVLKHGTFLAQRWEDDGGVNLYHCADENTRLTEVRKKISP
jgi:hypothetical protein